MRKIFLIVFSIVNSTFLFCQQDSLLGNSKQQKESKVALGFNVTPNNSFYFGQSDIPYKSEQHGSYSYGYGINVQIRIRKRFQFNTGVNFSHLKYIDDFVIPIFPIGSYRQYDFYFLSVPLQLQYNFIRRKHISLFLNIGVDASRLVTYKNRIYSPDKVNLNEYNYLPPQAPVMPFANFNIGIDNKIYKKLYSSVGIGYSYSIIPLISSYNTKRNLYSYNLSVGLKFKL